MKTEVLKVTKDSDIGPIVTRAISVLAGGGLVAFPTETVYGLGAIADNPQALNRLAEVKERPDDKPFTLHLGESEQIGKYVPDLSLLDRQFLRKALPGPLTPVFPLNDAQLAEIAKRFTAEQIKALYHNNSIGIRLPDNHIARKILNDSPGPVVAPSANLAGKTPPNRAEDVLEQLDGLIDLVIDDGPTKYRKPSTVVRLDGTGIEILRQGVLSESTLARMRTVNILFVCTGNTCRTPMAEALCKIKLAQNLSCSIDQLESLGYNVRSAGTMAWDSAPASEEAVQACSQLGIDISGHKASVLTEDLINWADFVFTMSQSHQEAVIDLVRQARAKTVTLAGDQNISDPIGQPLETVMLSALSR